jgi:primosomal protein N' (replication factor Y)
MIALNSAQRQAVAAIQSLDTTTRLLHGITGSGKTNIYLKLTEQIIYTGKSVILLLPEIALTTQLITNFEQHFPGQTVLLHSNQTEATRHRLWQSILLSKQPQIIIGPRSALFAPVHHLGLIIIDEAHEPAYYQDHSPKYSALRLASTIASHIPDCYVLLGTATPSVTDYYLAQQQHTLVQLDQLALPNPSSPTIEVIDLKSRADFPKHHFLSRQLLTSIQQSLDTHTQTLIFHNRRGTSPLTICDHCGWQALCPTCYLPLIHHADQYQLLCHTCGQHFPVPSVCPECHNPSIHHKGIGTKLIETELRRLFPQARIARFDGDIPRGQTLDQLYYAVRQGDYDILIGTQMIAKGFDFPLLTTLGVIQADTLFSLPDYSSEERGYQLLTQAIGRATRGHQAARVIIQTFQPAHPAIQAAIRPDQLPAYQTFTDHLLQTRRAGHLPPYRHLALLSLTYKTEATTIKHLRAVHAQLTAASQPADFISPPTPAFHERTPGGYTWQLTVSTRSRPRLLALLQTVQYTPGLRLRLDPPTLL